MGVPGFYSWLIRRYPLVKHEISKQQVPSIDYLYLDMNGIIYKCVKDDSIIFKSQIIPKDLEQIWLDVFNYINMLVNILKPNKMIVMGLDGVAPRAKMNNQRSRRFKSSRDHKTFMENFYGFTDTTESTENFKNNSISPGTAFMEELCNNLQFFIKKKIEQDDYWRSLSVIFTGSKSPGQGEHKIMQFIRANNQNFLPTDTHCLYGADADLIMLSMTLPIKNLCIIRQEFVPGDEKVKISESKKQKIINFEMIYITILKEYFQIEYTEIKGEMKLEFDIERIIRDFVFLFFFVGNDFLPRCYAYNIRQSSIEKLIEAFKQFLKITSDYVLEKQKINMRALSVLVQSIAQYELPLLEEKGQDMDKNNKKQFEKEFNQIIKLKAVKQAEFVNQLKMFYKNDQTQARKSYYGRYFDLNPAQKSQEFYQILSHYLYGLQFVFEYYFVCLPSWQWYYPYYFAPLASDLYFYISYLAENNYQLPKLEAGAPSEPFKQLLCILPKQSAQLLPLSFQKCLIDQNSILRKPVDFYPDNFEQQPYGTSKQFQSIALIPYLDLNLVIQSYNDAIKNISESQKQRNILKQSTLFQFDKNANEIIIDSKFKSIPQTKCTIKQTYVNLRQRIKWGENTPKYLQLVEHKRLLKMPTLKIKEINVNCEFDRFGRRYFVVKLLPIQKKQKRIEFKAGQQVFYGYPLERSGRVQAVLSQKSFVCDNNQFDTENYDIQRVGRFKDMQLLTKNYSKAFSIIKKFKQDEGKHVLNWQNCSALYFIRQTAQFIRCLDGQFRRVYRGPKQCKFDIVSSEVISKQKIYQNTRDHINFRGLEEQFAQGENVLVFPRYSDTGYVQKGKVVGYTEKKVKVLLGQKIKKINQKSLENIVHTRELYFSLKFCSFVLEMKPEVLLTLLQAINITISSPGLPPSIDIGLNFINRHEQKLVPNLVRLDFSRITSKDEQNPQKLFRFIDISLKGLELIIEYKRKFPQVLEFIEKRYEKLLETRSEGGKINWRQQIQVNQIFSKVEQQKKCVKQLMSVYLWLIKKEETHLPLSSLYSKQISVKNIKKLQQMFVEISQNEKNKKHKYQDPIVEDVDPNYLFSRRLATFGQMYLSKQPQVPTIRDQVICLKPQHFGELGVIIGFDDKKFEVMFTRPSFGKSDLNGICGNLWAGRFYERDLYNFVTWPQCMKQRHKSKNSAQNYGWSNNSKLTVPKYKEKPLMSFSDIQSLTKAKSNIFSEQFVNYMAEMKKKLNVQQIQQGYQVVDNRKGDFQHKYDKVSIKKQYVELIVKDKKYMEKKIQPIISVESDHKQIVENKIVEEDTANQGEDDGDDMLK